MEQLQLDGMLAMENEHYEPYTTHPNTGKNPGEIYDAAHNIAAHKEFERGDFVVAMHEADILVAGEYHVPFISHAVLEPHICTAYLDGYERLIVVNSTQVPYYTSRQMVAVLELPISRIRVMKPSVGVGGW